MKHEQLFSELKFLAEQLGIRVSEQNFRNAGVAVKSGFCRVKGHDFFFIDKHIKLQKKTSVLAEFLAEHPVDDNLLSHDVREYLHRHKSVWLKGKNESKADRTKRTSRSTNCRDLDKSLHNIYYQTLLIHHQPPKATFVTTPKGISNPQHSQLLSVSKLTQQIKILLEENYPIIWIFGEISNLRLPSSGHAYFSLKDETAQIAAVFFKGQLNQLKFKIADGMSIIGMGRISVYEPRGTYQIILEYAEPQGFGALQLAFEQLKSKLAQEGLFAVDRKKKLPFLPTRIGLITSPSGAVIHDLLTIIYARFPNLEVDIFRSEFKVKALNGKSSGQYPWQI